MDIMLQFKVTLFVEKSLAIDNVDELPQIEEEIRDNFSHCSIPELLRSSDGYDFENIEEAVVWSDRHCNYFESIDEFIDGWHDEHADDECDPDDEEVSNDDDDTDEGNVAELNQEAATRLIQSLLSF